MKTLLAAASTVAMTLAFGTPTFAGKSSPDDGIYSMYDIDEGGSFFNLSICGNFGCGGGYTNGFDHVCAVLESAPKVKNDVMTRDIYILDKRTKATDPMTLTVLHRVDDGVGGGDSFAVTLAKVITLDITGGSKANCKMVENPISVYLGTDISDHSVMIDKKKLKASEAQPGATTVLSADSRGYISISSSAAGGFMILDPNGSPVASGGGAENQVGTQTATVFN